MEGTELTAVKRVSKDVAAPAAPATKAPQVVVKVEAPTEADMEHGGKKRGFSYLFPKLNTVAKAVGLGVMGGVFIPTMNSIFGVVIFLRWGWAVGQAGIFHCFLILILGCSVAIITALSVAAISTNEVVKAGGAYYMISRSLGPAIGGSMGLLFYIAQALGVGFYTLGFSETVAATANVSWFPKPDGPGFNLNVVIIAILSTISVLILSLAGNALFAKLGTGILAGIVFSLVFAILSCWVQPVTESLIEQGFVGPQVEIAKKNWLPDYDSGMSFLTVFSVVYPSMTAILTGANMSGVLANPGQAIPIGTILAVIVMIISYGLVIVSLGVSCERHYLKTDFYMLQVVCYIHELVLIGTLLATFSSALSGFVGVSRVLQAMCHDKIFGYKMMYFGVEQGTRELMPRRAMFLTFVLAIAVLFFGDVNTVAPFLSNFMLITFASLNLAAMILDISHTPNYRPTFKSCNWKVSCFGGLLCLATMFMMDWIKALASLLLAFAFFLLLIKFPPPVDWGSPAQAVLYRVVMGYIMRMDFRPTPVKFWRPKVLCLVEDPMQDHGIIEFASACKKRGLLVLGHVMVGSPVDLIQKKRSLLMEATVDLREKRAITGFVEICIAPSLTAGTMSMLQLCGLGCMKPNTVVTGLPMHTDYDDEQSVSKTLDWWTSCVQTLQLGLNCIVACGFKDFDRASYVEAIKQRIGPERKPTIDVWLSGVGEYEGMYELFAAHTMCVLQMAYVFSLNQFWEKEATLRVVLLLPGKTEAEADTLTNGFRDMMSKVRLMLPIKVLCTGEAVELMHEMGLGPKEGARAEASMEAGMNGDNESEEDEPEWQPDEESEAMSSHRQLKKKQRSKLINRFGNDSSLETKREQQYDSDDEDSFRRKKPEIEMESDFDRLSLQKRTRVLNALMQRHSENAAVIFMQPAVSALAYKPGIAGARSFIHHQQLLCENLCPIAVVMPNDSQVDERVGGMVAPKDGQGGEAEGAPVETDLIQDESP